MHAHTRTHLTSLLPLLLAHNSTTYTHAGVDKDSNALVVAIIDFIRTYTWDKQLETWVKASGILGGSGKEPTIISPKQYMRRFRAAIPGYFTVVPGGAEVEPPLDPDAP